MKGFMKFFLSLIQTSILVKSLNCEVGINLKKNMQKENRFVNHFKTKLNLKASITII